MLNKKIIDALNKQIEYEAYAASSYLAMASWCEREGLRGCSEFFYEQSSEEREHMLKIVRYINGAGENAVIPAIEKPRGEYKSLKDIFETSLKQEQDVSKQIYKLVEQSFELRDFGTNHFMQWYVAEQLEEENLFRLTLDILRIAGKEDQSLLLIDNEIAKLRSSAEKPGDE